MNWFLLALIAPAIFSISGHIDKYLLSKYFKNVGAGTLIIFSSLIGLFVLPVILVIEPDVFSINIGNAALIIFNGVLYLIGLMPYLYALAKDEASTVLPIFQTIPVFSYVLAFLVLGEQLTVIQIAASLLMILGAVIISLDLLAAKLRFKWSVFWLMLLASFIFAINTLIFKFVAIKESFWVTSFWEYIGFVLFAIFLFIFATSYRKEFVAIMRQHNISILSINAFNEIINIIGKAVFNFATLLAPLALVSAVNGFQQAFIFIYGIILTLFFPSLGRESLIKKHLAQKLIAISIMLAGTYLLNL